MPVRRYDHPNTLVRREWHGTSLVTSAATSVNLPVYAAVRLIAAHGKVTTAGTNAVTVEGIYVDGGSVAALVIGTQAVGFTTSAGSNASPLGTATAFGNINVVKTGSAGGVCHIIYEYEVLADSVIS